MARKRRGSGHGDGGGGGGGHSGASGRWLVSYADFVTLMFVVFVVLFSMARLDASKYGSLARSLNQALGPVGPDIPPLPARGQLGTALPIISPERPGNLPDVPDWPAYLTVPVADGERAPIPPVEPPVTVTPPAPEAPVGGNTKPAPPPVPTDAMQGLADTFAGLPGVRSGVVALALEERGLVLTIAGRLLFDPGQATLKPAAYGELDSILTQLRGVEYPIMVIGNADETPTQTELSPWKLASLRASEVVEYLVKQGGMPGSSFTTIGYGSDGSGQGNASPNVTIVVMRKK